MFLRNRHSLLHYSLYNESFRGMFMRFLGLWWKLLTRLNFAIIQKQITLESWAVLLIHNWWIWNILSSENCTHFTILSNQTSIIFTPDQYKQYANEKYKIYVLHQRCKVFYDYKICCHVKCEETLVIVTKSGKINKLVSYVLVVILMLSVIERTVLSVLSVHIAMKSKRQCMTQTILYLTLQSTILSKSELEDC